MSRVYAKPTPQARKYSIAGAKTDGKRIGKIAPRQCDPAIIGAAANRQPVRCVSCEGPRDPRKGPVCPTCTARRKEGMRG